MPHASGDLPPAAFSVLLRAHRERARLTQEELSERTGISVRAISDIERGVAKSPQRRTVAALAGPLRLTEIELDHFQTSAKAARLRTASTAADARVFSGALVGALPPDIDDLSGRERELGALRELAEEVATGERAGTVLVLTGPPGTGKTTLATSAAHALAPRFPDGQVFLKLRGMSSEPRTPTDLLHVVLRSMGVDGVRVPAELEQRTNLCRFLLKDRRALLVLDDAAEEAQVRPLLVGGPRCLTLVTSRQMLLGLTGVSRFVLDVLDRAAAVALVSTIAGPTRVADEPDAAGELVELCGRLPLALRIAGNRLAGRARWPIGRLVGQLRDRGRRLSTLTAGDLGVRDVFDLSYRQLSARAATAFRRLALVPGADFGAGAVAALTGLDEEDAGAVLEELADASLLLLSQVEDRYQFHDLLRVFAAECLARDEPPQAAREAEARLVEWLVRTATAAAGGHFRPSSTPAPVGPSFADDVEAGRWLREEESNWLGALRGTAARGEHRAVIELAEAMHWYSEIGGTAATWLEVFGLGLDSALATGSRHDEAVLRGFLSWTLHALFARSADAADMARSARTAAEAVGDLREQAWARVYLANCDPTADHPRLLDEAVELFDRADDHLGLHLARMYRGANRHQHGDHRAAAAEFAACLEFFRPPPVDGTPIDHALRAYVLLRAAQNHAALGDLTPALANCAEAMTLFRASASTVGQARVSQTWGRLAHTSGDLDEARSRLHDAFALFGRAGQPQRQVETLRDLASVAEAAGHPLAARQHRDHAAELSVALPGDVR
ncbi:NB-ARC domain-containing protein [Actinokineospora auranticolor]|uniref:Helix-turn-helix protein n=1 Tax=Actinokineospora auranticolor TaxID=155976 RepID=A0A2S6GD46_9PSEU|nr:NB-ARC domain-containing protein [Actinokineospora auranticolor]PPK63177.1 helix-turn-helix protein [Actinokineospora auranticolor]